MSTTQYHAYHCRYCNDTGADDGSHDPTMWDNVNRRARSCFACDGFGVILILARLDQPGRRPRPYEGSRWPERDMQEPETGPAGICPPGAI